MTVALLLAAALTTAPPMEVRLKDGATWTLVADHSLSTERDGKTESWSLKTEKRLTWRKGGFTRNAQVTVTPLSATPGPGSPPEVAKGRSFPVEAAVEVDASLMPTRFVDQKAVRAVFAEVAGRDLAGVEALADPAAMAMIAAEMAVVGRAQAFPLVPGKPYVHQTSLPGPVAGFELKARTTYLMETYDETAGRAVVTWRQEVDPTSFNDSVASLLAFVAKASPDKLEKTRTALADMAMTRDEACRYELDLRSGLATKADCESLVSISSSKSQGRIIERWAITQTLPETR